MILRILSLLILAVSFSNVSFGEILDDGIACVMPLKTDGTYNAAYRLRYVVMSGNYINEGTRSQSYDPHINYVVTEWPEGKYSVFDIAFDSELMPVDVLTKDELGRAHKIKKSYSTQCS